MDTLQSFARMRRAEAQVASQFSKAVLTVATLLPNSKCSLTYLGFVVRRGVSSPSGTFLCQKNYGTSLKDGECIKILTKQGMEMYSTHGAYTLHNAIVPFRD